MVGGEYFGSCDYPDLCLFIKRLFSDSFEPDNCLENYPVLTENEIDCTCPFKIRQGILDIENIDFNIYDLAATPFAFLGSGDFDVTANVSDSRGNVANFGFKFSMKPRSSCKNIILLFFALFLQKY